MESLVLLLLAGALLVLMVSRTRRQQREVSAVQSRLDVGSSVMTTAGLFATVVALDDESVTLETAPGQTSRWDRRAVAKVLTSAPAEAAPAAAGSGAEPAPAVDAGPAETSGPDTNPGGVTRPDDLPYSPPAPYEDRD